MQPHARQARGRSQNGCGGWMGEELRRGKDAEVDGRKMKEANDEEGKAPKNCPKAKGRPSVPPRGP